MKQSEKLIDKIRKDKIKPIPKWYFSTKNRLIWGTFIVFVLIGAAAFSVILYSIQQTDFNILTHLTHSKMEFVLGLLPFFWLITLLVFLIAAMFVIQKSKRGYKYFWSQLVGISTAISIALGTLFFIAGGGQWIENTFAERVALYKSIDKKKKQIWMNPTEGYLSGVINEVNDEQLSLMDFNDKQWEIIYTDAFIPPAVFLEKGEKIKLVGQITGKRLFKAEEIRPWGGEGLRKKMMERRKKWLEEDGEREKK